MRKKLVIQILFVLFATVLLVSCEKIEIQDEIQDENIDLSSFKHEVVSFVDNKEVTADLKNYSADLLIVERQKINYNKKIITTERLGFTSEKEYIDFGIENNYPLKEELEFVALMREYIETNNVEEYYAKNEEFPDGYIKYEENLHSIMFPEKKGVPSLLLGLVFSKEAYGVGGHWIAFVKTWPVMLPGWNNTLSSYQPVGLAGVVSFYNRTFYRDHLFTRVQWAMTWYNMYSADNCVSSWFRI